MTKQELRQYIRTLKRQYLTGGRLPTSVSLTEGLPPFSAIMLYSALADEVPTQELMDALAAQGKMVLLPRVVNSTDMELRCYTCRHDLQAGAFGILEPTGQLFTDYDAISVAIVPGMAFDGEGHRLGRGKGYYDRFLTRLPSAYKVGLCFSWQLVDRVPSDVHDMVMDKVLTV